MSRKIKVQTVNTDNLEKILKENICTKTLESGISPALIEKTRKLMDKLREEDNNPCNNDNTGDASAYTNKDDNSTVVNIHDIKIKNLVERFKDIILDITTDDFTDNISVDDKSKKIIRRNKDCNIVPEDFQLFLDIVNLNTFDKNYKLIPENIKGKILYLHGLCLHEKKINIINKQEIFLNLGTYYNFLINNINIPYNDITEDSYYVRLANHYINNYCKSEFDVPDEDLNKLSKIAGTNYNIIKDKIDEINNRPNDYAKCREYYNSKDTARHLKEHYNSVDTLIARDKANKDSSRFNKNDCTRIKPINDVTEEFKQAKVIGNAFKTFRDENGVTKYGSLKDVDKVLNSLGKIDVNQPGELLLSIPQDYEAPSIIAKVNPCNMEEINNMKNNNIECNKHYEEVNHPDHYNVYDVEVVEMMERIFGIEETMSWCKLNAFKYRMRAGEKPTSTVEKDLKKEKWCLNKYKELKSKN